MVFFAIIGVGVFVYGLSYLISLCLVDCDLELAFYSKFGKSPRRLRGKVVFITGASSGIGEQLAVALARHGVRLVIAARRRDELERVKRVCVAISGGMLSENDILVIAMDVTDIAAQRRHFDYALRHFGTIDILVNNAGRSQRAVWENIDLAVDKQMFDLNVFSVINLSRIAMDHFNKKGTGHIAVVSSLAGVMGVPWSGSYCGTKFAIHGYFNSLRSEKTGQSVTVTLLCPGPTFTNFLQESFVEKDGQKYGIRVNESDRRMTAERCGELCAIALTNKLPEVWMGLFPIIPLTYVYTYFPLVHRMVFKLIGPSYIMKLRDSDNSTKLTELQEKRKD